MGVNEKVRVYCMETLISLLAGFIALVCFLCVCALSVLMSLPVSRSGMAITLPLPVLFNIETVSLFCAGGVVCLLRRSHSGYQIGFLVFLMGVVSLVLDGYFITGVEPDPSGWFPQSSFDPPYKGYALGSVGISLLAIVIGGC